MAKITYVDYELMPVKAREMRGYAKELNVQMLKVYKDVEEMRSFKYWAGDRYNTLVRLFNLMVPDLNEMLELIVTKIPLDLEQIASNYSRADNGTSIPTNDEQPQKILESQIHNDIGITFLTDQVSNVQEQINTKFASSLDLLNKFEKAYNEIPWQSEAAEKYKSRFTYLKNSISNSIENIKSQFTTLMHQAKDEMEKAEKANTVQ